MISVCKVAVFKRISLFFQFLIYKSDFNIFKEGVVLYVAVPFLTHFKNFINGKPK